MPCVHVLVSILYVLLWNYNPSSSRAALFKSPGSPTSICQGQKEPPSPFHNYHRTLLDLDGKLRFEMGVTVTQNDVYWVSILVQVTA